jgi:hypothetical protein
VQAVMLNHLRHRVQKLQLQLAQERAALAMTREKAAEVERGLLALQKWVLARTTDDSLSLPEPQLFSSEALGEGYGERTKTFYRHFDEVTRTLLSVHSYNMRVRPEARATCF